MAVAIATSPISFRLEASDFHNTRRQFQHEQHVIPDPSSERHHLDREQIGCRKHFPV